MTWEAAWVVQPLVRLLPGSAVGMRGTGAVGVMGPSMPRSFC